MIELLRCAWTHWLAFIILEIAGGFIYAVIREGVDFLIASIQAARLQ